MSSPYVLPNKSKKDMHEVAKGAIKHSFLVEEQAAFVEHVNSCLGNDAYLKEHGYLPIRPDTDDLYKAMADGIMLCKLINLAAHDTIDERALNFPVKGKQLNPWEMTENQNIAINSAKSIGVQVVNIGAKDLINCAADHREYLLLGLVWQIVKLQLMAGVSINEHPEIYRLLQEGESLPDLLKLPPEETLLRWINFHLAKQGDPRKITNFSEALKDGTVYLTLLNSINPAKCPKDAISLEDVNARAVAVIENARALEVPVMIQSSDITSGNRKLNLAFVAQIFNTNHGLEMKAEEMKVVEQAFESAEMSAEPEEDAREERVFRLWMNSLNLNDGATVVHSLFKDLSEGATLVDAILAVAGDSVSLGSRKVNREKINNFKRVENCNLAVALGKELGLSLPGLGGVDIANRNTKLVLGFVWQLMRLQVLRVLRDVGGGTVPKDADILEWANATVMGLGKENAIAITGFKDPALSSGTYLLDLLSAVEPRAVNAALVTPGSTPEEKMANAKYVISVARKLGCTVFLTWEDIVDVKPKMVMTLVATIWQQAIKRTAARELAMGSSPSR